MRFFGNLLWFIFGGWYLALSWLVGALVFAITIIGLPLTRSAIEMAKLSAFPFGKDVLHIRDLDGNMKLLNGNQTMCNQTGDHSKCNQTDNNATNGPAG